MTERERILSEYEQVKKDFTWTQYYDFLTTKEKAAVSELKPVQPLRPQTAINDYLKGDKTDYDQNYGKQIASGPLTLQPVENSGKRKIPVLGWVAIGVAGAGLLTGIIIAIVKLSK